MIRYISDNERISKFLIEQGAGNVFYDFTSLGIEKDGEVIAGMIYDMHEEGARCFMHCAGIGSNWLTKEFLWMMFDYPFNQLNVNVIIGPISSNNKKSIKFAEHIGFKLQASITGGVKDGDLLIYTLYKQDCKWIRK